MNCSKIPAASWSGAEDVVNREAKDEFSPDDRLEPLCAMCGDNEALLELYWDNNSSSTFCPQCFNSDPISPATARRGLVLGVLMKEVAEIVTSYLCPIQGFKRHTIQGSTGQDALDIFDRGEGEVLITWQKEFSIHFACDGRLLHRNPPREGIIWDIGLGNCMTLTRSMSSRREEFQLQTFDSKTLELTEVKRLDLSGVAAKANIRSGVSIGQEVYLLSASSFVAVVGNTVHYGATSFRIASWISGIWRTFSIVGPATNVRMAVLDGRIYLASPTSIQVHSKAGRWEQNIDCSDVLQVIPNFYPVHIAVSPDFFYIAHHYSAPEQPIENLIVILHRDTGALWDYWGEEGLSRINKLSLIGDSLWVCDGDRVVLFR